MFNTTDLTTLYYSMMFRYPKVCSHPLRESILKLILDDFQLLSIDELTFFMMTQTTTNKLSVFLLWMQSIENRKAEIFKLSDANSPEVLVNLIYAYSVGRIPKHKRKTRGIEVNTNKEFSDFVELFLEKILERFDELSLTSIYRLGSSLEMAGSGDFYEVYLR